jgi:hypothetical protein
MNLTKVKIENEGTILVAENGIMDITSFLDPKRKLILIKRIVNGWLYLFIFDERDDKTYRWRSGNKHNKISSVIVNYPECKKILNL